MNRHPASRIGPPGDPAAGRAAHPLALALALAVALGAGSATAAAPAPGEVAFDDTGAVAQSLTGAPGNPEAGIKIATTNALGNCVACHVIGALPDVQFPGNIGPALDGAASRYSEAELRGIVIDAKHRFPDTFMPAMYKTGPFIRPGAAYTGKAPEGELPPILTAEQVEDVVAFLMTLKD